MYVLSAVRTPVALLNGSLCEFSIGQLSAIAFREALERAVVPVEDVEHLFVGCALDRIFEREIIKRISLPKFTEILTSKCSLECFAKACQFIHQQRQKVCLIGGVESTSNNALFNGQNSLEVAIKSLAGSDFGEKFLHCISSGADWIHTQRCKNNILPKKNNALCDELVKINFRKKGIQIVAAEDEQIKSSNASHNFETLSETLLLPGDGAAASVLADEEYVRKHKLTPLAQVISFASEPIHPDEYFSAVPQIIEKVLDIVGFDSGDISMWEISALDRSTLFSSISDKLNINPSSINTDGGIFSNGFPIGMYGGKMISHITHSLSPGQLGCAAGLSINGTASAVVLKKLCSRSSTKPQLTLYTKKECPLCDDLEKELEPYKSRFSLEKIDIESDSNEKTRNLYQYEIPVLFIDGTFLCKHKLDLENFNRRLRQSEESQFSGHPSFVVS